MLTSQLLRKSAKRLAGQLITNNYQTLNRIELDSEHVLANVALIQSQDPSKAIIPVLKANAYGHGLTQIANILNRANCAFIAVDGYFEAAQIRKLTIHPILVMGYIKPENVKLLDTKPCSFAVQDLESLKAFGSLKKPVRIHLELETGMHRLGLTTQELQEYLKVLKRYPKLQLEGVMTHLADADNPGSPLEVSKQVSIFDKAVKQILLAGWQPRVIHLAQTAGSLKANSQYANAIRPGIGLYGINPLSPGDAFYDKLTALQPVLRLKSTIIKTYDLRKGEKIGYNYTFTASGNMRIGVLPLGYYEAVPRELGNKGFVIGNNQSLPIVGKVCMNHTMIDISNSDLSTGDSVIVISNDSAQLNSIQRVTETHNIFAYSWLANLSASVRRVVV